MERVSLGDSRFCPRSLVASRSKRASSRRRRLQDLALKLNSCVVWFSEFLLMANLGGGAEAHARFKQYEYRANSSLVLTTDSRRRDAHEPTVEPKSLWGKIDPRSFGDRVYKGRPPELDEKLKKSKKKKERDPACGASSG
ncbi:hypothetical protein V6N13_061811 [Hibiscus sabdariffa]